MSNFQRQNKLKLNNINMLTLNSISMLNVKALSFKLLNGSVGDKTYYEKILQ